MRRSTAVLARSSLVGLSSLVALAGCAIDDNVASRAEDPPGQGVERPDNIGVEVDEHGEESLSVETKIDLDGESDEERMRRMVDEATRGK